MQVQCKSTANTDCRDCLKHSELEKLNLVSYTIRVPRIFLKSFLFAQPPLIAELHNCDHYQVLNRVPEVAVLRGCVSEESESALWT